MRLPPRKKKIFPPVFPTDPVGAEFCKWFWSLNKGWNFIRSDRRAPGEKARWTTEPYPIQPLELWLRHADPNELLGVCFKKFTRYFVIDIDRGSKYHPLNGEALYASLLAVLRSIGLNSPVVIRSSWSEGLHLYYPLPKAISSFGIACAVKWTLFDHGILLGDGQLETFPNTKSFGTDGNFVQYKCHRLPLQPESGSYLLDASLEPYSDEVADLLDEFNTAAVKQNLELLKPVMAVSWKRQAQSRGFGSSGRAEKWRRHLERRLSTGWTAFSQTNGLIKDIATYGRVFVRLDGRALTDYTMQTATSAPGYERFCRHQYEIRLRVSDWSRCVEAYYWPYGSEHCREGTYSDHFHQELANDCPRPENNIVGFPRFNQLSSQAEKRIVQAVAHLEESGNLPKTTTARSHAIIAASKELTGIGISQTTLHKPKYLPLWHPAHYHPQDEKSVIDCQQPIPAVSSGQEYPILPDSWFEPESPQPAPQQARSENYTFCPYMKGLLCLPPADDEPQAQSEVLDSENSENSENSLKSSEQQTHKEIKYQENSSAVGFDDKPTLSVNRPKIDSTPNDATLAPVETAPTTFASSPDPALTVPDPDALTPLDHKQIAMLRLQALAHAHRSVKIQALIEGRLIRGVERTHLEQVQKMQFYWQSGSELLRAEARTWAFANPGCLPEIDQLDPDSAELSPPDPLSLPTVDLHQSQNCQSEQPESNAKSTLPPTSAFTLDASPEASAPNPEKPAKRPPWYAERSWPEGKP